MPALAMLAEILCKLPPAFSDFSTVPALAGLNFVTAAR